MKRSLFLLFLFSFLLMNGCDGEDSKEPQQNSDPVLSFSPDDASISVGDQISLQLVAQNLTDSVFAFSAQISYADSILSFSGISETAEGDFFGSEVVQFVHDTLSVLHVTISRIQGQTEVSGSGTICILNFAAVASGNYVVGIISDQLEFYNSEGLEVEIPELETNSASIHVN